MSTNALTLVLASAFVHALWNAILKRCQDAEGAVLAAGVVSGACALAVGAALGFHVGSLRALAWCVVAGLLEAAYFQGLARALAAGALGTAYTVSRGVALLVVWPVSVLLLGEALTPLRVGGTLLVITGLAAASGKRLSGGVRIALLTGVFIGGYNLAYKLALSGGVSSSTANATALTIAALINIASVSPDRRGRAIAALRTNPAKIGGAGVLAATGFLLFLAALAYTGAGVVVTLRNTSILFATAMGMAQGERPSRLAIAGTLTVTAGAVLLAL